MTQALNADPWTAFLEGFQESGASARGGYAGSCPAPRQTLPPWGPLPVSLSRSVAWPLGSSGIPERGKRKPLGLLEAWAQK